MTREENTYQGSTNTRACSDVSRDNDMIVREMTVIGDRGASDGQEACLHDAYVMQLVS